MAHISNGDTVFNNKPSGKEPWILKSIMFNGNIMYKMVMFQIHV